MGKTPSQSHPSDSSAQRSAELGILEQLEQQIGARLDDDLDIDSRVQLDGFQDGPTPVCVEAFAHQGPAKSGQRRKLMMDMCKLLLVEKVLRKPCRKILAVCDEEAVGFLKNSWQGSFAREFGIEVVVVEITPETRRRLLEAQKIQYR